jgi:hypothetical protein
MFEGNDSVRKLRYQAKLGKISMHILGAENVKGDKMFVL